MKTFDDIFRELARIGKEPSGVYGDKVLRAAALYSSLTDARETTAYYRALEKLLTSSKESQRRFAVGVCLGFFVFRDQIAAPRLKR